MGKSDNSGNSKAAETKKEFEEFLKQVETKCNEAKFTEEQTKEILDLVKSKDFTPGTVGEIRDKFEEIAKQNANADETTDAENRDFAELIETEDFMEFLQILEVTNQIKKNTNLLDLDGDSKLDLEARFNGWVEGGKQKPSFDTVKAKIKQIVSVTRRKWKGKFYLSYVIDGEKNPQGIKLIPIYRKIKDPNTNALIEDKSMRLDWKKEYTIEYSRSEAEKLVKRCLKESKDPKFYLAQGENSFVARVTNIENFYTDKFDEMYVKGLREVI